MTEKMIYFINAVLALCEDLLLSSLSFHFLKKTLITTFLSPVRIQFDMHRNVQMGFDSYYKGYSRQLSPILYRRQTRAVRRRMNVAAVVIQRRRPRRRKVPS